MFERRREVWAMLCLAHLERTDRVRETINLTTAELAAAI
jgi:hypothetical protein